MHPAITIDSLGKLYKLEHAGTRPGTFRDLVTEMALSPWRRFRQLSGRHASMEDFWAIRDVSFDVAPGEVIGIVGRNGAGKSTLLKVLSRIVEPTTGSATLRGRVASLLEVGTGFHPELTGRENVFLNGSILGMKKREIAERFDEIVDFAEIEKFLDTPVKRYSSGMYVRLAFAVAAHLNPEILIVDEVLAVGDAEFQKKCLGKMQQVSTGSGRTVLFVSHNMAAVQGLCSKAVWLRGGRVAEIGPADSVVQSYLRTSADTGASLVEFSRPKSASIWMTRAAHSVNDAEGSGGAMGDDIALNIDFEADIPVRNPRLGWVLTTLDGQKVLNSNNRYPGSPQYAHPVTKGRVVCRWGQPSLMPGRYVVSLWLGDLQSDHHVELEALTFEVTERDLWGHGQIPPRVTPMWWPSTYEFEPAALSPVSLATGIVPASIA